MSDLGHYVCSESVAAARAHAMLTICELGEHFVASWECSCGAENLENLEAHTIGIAVQLGRDNFREHCAAEHP